jgi:RNA polymerase primary sigma factor
MATKSTAADTDTDTDGPLIDLNEADVKKLIARGKKRGYLTYDELNAALPQDEMSSEQIEDIMSAISDMGINIVESDEDVQEEADQEPDDEVDVSAGTGSVSNPAIEKKKETVDRTDDPVRMYLREMGAVELLSREGDIAIAKRIEAGRDTMILGLCESPLTFNAIIDWSNALNNGEMQLREIVDLEAMLSKDPVPENLEEEGAEDNGEISEKTAGVSFKDEDDVGEEPAADSDDEDGENSSGKRETFEEDEEDNTLSLAAMEELLKPDALEKFANITKSFKAFSKLQDARLEALSTAGEFPSASEKKYHKLREELTTQVESVQFHNTKIEYLVDQLYSYNRRLTALGGQMLRLAERHKVPRKAFLESYMGHELDEN